MPWEPSFLCAVDAGTGSQGDLGRFVLKETGITLQGALLASKDNLYAPQVAASHWSTELQTANV